MKEKYFLRQILKEFINNKLTLKEIIKEML